MPTYQTIHLTDSIKHSMMTQINRLLAVRIKEPMEALAATGDKFYDALVPQIHRDVLSAVPSYYLDTYNSIIVSVKGSSASYTLNFTTPKVLPDQPDPSIHGVEKNWREYIIVDKLRFAETIAAIDAYAAEKAAVERDTNSMQGRVRTVLKQYKTLRQLLKDHPTLWELVPPDVQRKYSTPVATTPRQKQSVVLEPKSEVNLDDLTVVLATNKLLGGQ